MTEVMEQQRPGSEPKSMRRATHWSDEVENAYRFQLAGYRDQFEYMNFQQIEQVERWPESGYVKKLKRRDGCFYYYNHDRECSDKDVPKCKIYIY